MTSMDELAQRRWSISLGGLSGTYAEPGWTFEESFDNACPSCQGQLHLAGKPYPSSGATYRYAAFVCPSCAQVFSLDDVGAKSRETFRSLHAGSRWVTSDRSPRRSTSPPDGLVIARAWPLPDAQLASSAVTGVLDEMVRRGTVEGGLVTRSVLAGQAGQIERLIVGHQRTSWGCVSSEVRLVSPSVGREGLHVVARECQLHPPRSDVGAGDYSFAAEAARVSRVATMGVDPFRVGHTTAESVPRLVERLRDPSRRAPIVLLSGQALAREATALSARATGAALVATIDGDASWELSRQLGATLGCYAGAVRAYPPFENARVPECPVWVSRRVAQEGWPAVADQILATVASLGGVSPRLSLEAELEREAATAALREASAKIEELTRDLADQTPSTAEHGVNAHGDGIDAIFDLQNEKIEALTKDLEDVQIRNIELEDKLAAAEQFNNSLRMTLKHQNWDEINVDRHRPVAIIDPTVEAAIERLGDPAGALVCTENALKAWRDAKYPDSDRMLDAIRRLERAAQEWRDAETKIGGRLKGWMYELVGLRYAASDHGLEQRHLHLFEFDGATWSRVPHVKIDDAKHADQVGRIYFAIDAPNKRWIVDHVGQKLYGR